MDSVSQVKPIIKHKSFTYQTGITWLGGKAGMLSSGEKTAFRVASPPEFRGEEGVWTPEDLFVAAADTCILMTFLSFAERRKLEVVSYTGQAEGLLEFSEGSYRFTKLMIRPTIVVRNPEDIELAEKTFHEAHSKCLITNSIYSEVILEPQIVVQ